MDEPPLDFDSAVYRSLNVDLAAFNDDQLQRHYDLHGRHEGRRSHIIADRTSFAALASLGDSLEIGPFARPLLIGPRVRYADIYSTDQLRKMAPTFDFDPADVPQIDWVVEPGSLEGVDGMFDAALSSHAIEHQPNLVEHLRQVSALLRPGGRYLVIAPDHRFCFDHFKPTSTIVDVLDAYARAAPLHGPKTVILNRLMMTHNDAVRHWSGDHGRPDHNVHFPNDDRIKLLRDAMEMLAAGPASLYDNHAWCFTPDSFSVIVNDLSHLQLIDFSVERLYPTLHNTLEFWAILRKPD